MRRLLSAALVAGIASVIAVAIATAHEDHSTDEWPMTCVDLNDIVEEHLGNSHNIGIYQRTFGDGAEQACRHDHGDDVRSTFGWATSAAGPRGADGTSDPAADAEQACRNDHRDDVRSTFGWAISVGAPSGAGGTSETMAEEARTHWPTTCVELNDIVETHLGNHENVGIYQRAFGDDDEGACRDDISATSRWTVIGGLPWVADGIAGAESVAVDVWNEIADKRWELAALIACSAWFADGPDGYDSNSHERQTLRRLAHIAWSIPALVEPVSGFSWLADDLTDSESYAIFTLTELVELDVELAVLAAGFPWIRDGIRRHENVALSSLTNLVWQGYPQLAWQVAEVSLEAPAADRNIYLPDALLGLYFHDYWDGQSDYLERVTSQPWFTDGLDAEEVAFLTAFEAAGDARLYDELLVSRFTQHTTVSLPLTGEVNLWAFQADPFPAGDDLLVMMEQGVRGAETLMGAPFPTTDVIVLVVRERKYLGGSGATFDDSLVRIARTQEFIDRSIVYHEVAHYYLPGRIGPHWLVEGGANFVEAYTLDAFGHRSLGESKRVYSEAVKDQCTAHGIGNIHQIHIHQMKGGDEYQQGYRCGYPIGAHFLISMLEVLGKEPLSAALWELSLGSLLNPFNNEAEDYVYRVFLKHMPVGLEGQFRDLYRRLHGGPYVDAGS